MPVIGGFRAPGAGVAGYMHDRVNRERALLQQAVEAQRERQLRSQMQNRALAAEQMMQNQRISATQQEAQSDRDLRYSQLGQAGTFDLLGVLQNQQRIGLGAQDDAARRALAERGMTMDEQRYQAEAPSRAANVDLTRARIEDILNPRQTPAAPMTPEEQALYQLDIRKREADIAAAEALAQQRTQGSPQAAAPATLKDVLDSLAMQSLGTLNDEELNSLARDRLGVKAPAAPPNPVKSSLITNMKGIVEDAANMKTPDAYAALQQEFNRLYSAGEQYWDEQDQNMLAILQSAIDRFAEISGMRNPAKDQEAAQNSALGLMMMLGPPAGQSPTTQPTTQPTMMNIYRQPPPYSYMGNRR